jgi:subtilisin family serine protease
MKKLATILVLIAIVAMVVPVSAAPAAKGAKDTYVVIMAADPAVAYEGGVEGMPATKPGKGGKINPNSAHVKKYEKFLEKEHDKTLEAVGLSPSAKIYDYTIALNGFAVRLTEAQVDEMAKQPGVAMVLPDVVRYPTTDSAPDFLGLTADGGPWVKGYDGEGVVVGVLDTGIWPEHPSFADDGSYPLPPVTLEDLPDYPACDFGNAAHNPDDAPFTCNNKLIGARHFMDIYKAYGPSLHADEYDSARDDNGHGSHTTSTAAGNAGVEASIYGIPRGTISGIAPRAHVIMYKVCGGGGCYSSDSAAAVDQAVADGVDVINHSIGGGASGPGADEIAFLFAADAGVSVATSAGNSGPGAASVGNPGTMPWMTTVGANTQSRFFQGTAVLGDGAEYYGASITAGTDELQLVDAEDYGNELCDPAAPFTGDVSGKIVLCRRGATARADKSRAVFEAGGAGMIMYNNSDVDNLATDSHWVPSVHIDQTPGLAIKAYIASATDPTAMIYGGVADEWPYAPSMTIFSSRGPNPVAPDIIKPDITAPGTQILAGDSPTPARSWDAYLYPGQLFQAIQGTSMSSPVVAGVFALLKQAHPDWSAAIAKSAIMTTAYQDVRDNDRMSMADPFDMGAGHLNPGGEWSKGSIDEPGLAYDAGFYDYLGFLCDAFPEVVSASTCAFLESIEVPTQAYNLNYPSIGIGELPGSQTVQRTVTSVAKENGWRTYNVAVDPPPGYSVTVVPSTFRLKRGDTATYEVTITNVSAPVGEWRFGSLTWNEKNGEYSVRSPIAVRGTLFSAPAEISGSGESGSASFDVNFGYNGSYAAAAHGLEPATVTSDNVLQDPDQDFDPNDGYSNLHQFTLSGTALFRIAMPPEATEPNADLDIFVYAPGVVPDPDNYYASSTSGGTNELIDLVLPMDGTWSVYVHGWSAPGGDSDYDMYTWDISATPGGNLTIDSAPTAAALGATEAIDLSWTGATTGEWHLGAVSHTGDVGLMGLTLVNVDNR